MTNLDKKILDFKTLFGIGGWLNEEISFTKVDEWFRKNFQEEEVEEVEEVAPVETPPITGESLPSGAPLCVGDIKTAADPVPSPEKDKDTESPEVDALEVMEGLELNDGDLIVTPDVNRDKGGKYTNEEKNEEELIIATLKN